MVQSFTAPQSIVIPRNADLRALRDDRNRGYRVTIEGFAIFNIGSYYPVVQNGRCIAFAEVLGSSWSGNYKDTSLNFRLLSNARNLCDAYNVILSYTSGGGNRNAAPTPAPEDRYSSNPQEFIPGALTGEQFGDYDEKPRKKKDRNDLMREFM